MPVGAMVKKFRSEFEDAIQRGPLRVATPLASLPGTPGREAEEVPV